MTLKYVVIGIIATLAATVNLPYVYATALSRSDIDTNPEGVCVTYGDEPGWKPICDWINICDDDGAYNSSDLFCQGDAVRNTPYPPGGCPEGYYSEEDDESGLCYNVDIGCLYEGLIMNREKTSCNSIIRECQKDPFLERCKVERNLGIPNNLDPQNCEPSVPDHCFVPYKPRQDYKNGTIIPSTDLECRDVNVTGFRVTMADRHNFDRDYDGLGCETINK